MGPICLFRCVYHMIKASCSPWTDVAYKEDVLVQKRASGEQILRQNYKGFGLFDSQDPLFVLIHGYARDGSVFEDVAHRLRSKGYDVLVLNYASRYMSLDEVSTLFSGLLQGFNRPIILVGHSLGGYVALDLAYKNPDLIQKTILIASPVSGSLYARFLWSLKPLRRYCGPMMKTLSKGYHPNRSVPHAMISFVASRRGFVLKGAHDTTVALSETRFVQQSYHVSLNGTHTSGLKNPYVVDEILRYVFA